MTFFHCLTKNWILLNNLKNQVPHEQRTHSFVFLKNRGGFSIPAQRYIKMCTILRSKKKKLFFSHNFQFLEIEKPTRGFLRDFYAYFVRVNI